jgi:hypothetical protein
MVVEVVVIVSDGFMWQQVKSIEHKYTLVCDTCGGENPRYRRPRQDYSCAKCEPNKFDERYLLRVVQNF